MCYKKKEPFLYLVQVIYIMMQLLLFSRYLNRNILKFIMPLDQIL